MRPLIIRIIKKKFQHIGLTGKEKIHRKEKYIAKDTIQKIWRVTQLILKNGGLKIVKSTMKGL